MPPTTRSADIAAPPQAVWAYLADLPSWADWDPDILRVDDVRGGLVDGGSFRVHMRRGLRTTITFSDVSPTQRATWTGSFFAGLVTAQGTFLLSPRHDGAHTRLGYRFALLGRTGRLAARLDARTITHGVERGLANIAAARTPQRIQSPR